VADVFAALIALVLPGAVNPPVPRKTYCKCVSVVNPCELQTHRLSSLFTHESVQSALMRNTALGELEAHTSTAFIFLE